DIVQSILNTRPLSWRPRDRWSTPCVDGIASPLPAPCRCSPPLRRRPRSKPLRHRPPATARANRRCRRSSTTWSACWRCAPRRSRCWARRKLVEQAPDNAAVWLLKFGLDTRDMKSDAARADLAKAAAAKLYDDYTGSSLAALAGVVDALPPPPATQGAGGPVGVQALIVQGNARLQPRPALPIVAKLCENAGDDAAIKLDCLKLGKLLEWGSSPLARSLGLHLREVLGDATAQAEARQQRRDLIWQVRN